MINLTLLQSALFGIATRRAVVDYLRMVLLILFILIAIAWTIDLAQYLPQIRDKAATDDTPLWQILLPYLTYRSADMVTRMLSMACFFGVFLAEIARRARLETVILTAAGAGPARMLSAVLIFGLGMGALNHMLETRWRPAAVAAQVELGLGAYGGRFRVLWINEHAWFMSPDMAIRAQVLRADPPALRDVLIFTGLREPRLTDIYAVDRAAPTQTLKDWHLEGVEQWDASAGRATSQKIDDLTLTLDLTPDELSYYGIPGFYLPTEPLTRLAHVQDPVTSTGAQVALWRRRTVWVLPGALALLAVCLSQLGYSGRQANYPKLIAMAVLGYAAVVSIKVLWAVGALGGLAPWLAASGSGLAILTLSAALVWRKL